MVPWLRGWPSSRNATLAYLVGCKGVLARLAEAHEGVVARLTGNERCGRFPVASLRPSLVSPPGVLLSLQVVCPGPGAAAARSQPPWRPHGGGWWLGEKLAAGPSSPRMATEHTSSSQFLLVHHRPRLLLLQRDSRARKHAPGGRCSSSASP